VTGGYPVVGVVDRDDLWQCAQLRPGDEVRFTPSPGPLRPDARP
jgi:allophanate hydrolase subunit 2